VSEVRYPLFRNLQELTEYLGEYLPEATVGEDNDGQIVIYTNLYERDDWTLAYFDEEEDA
jgi:hypothetical protein